MTPRRAIVVRCLRCRHEGLLSEQSLVSFGLKQDAPISAFVKRLRCSECGSGSVICQQPSARKQLIKSGQDRNREGETGSVKAARLTGVRPPAGRPAA